MQVTKEQVADGVRFELTEGVNPRRFSRPLHSTALPSIRGNRIFRYFAAKIKIFRNVFYKTAFLLKTIR